MPLTGLRLSRFKCYADSGSIPIEPLTLIFGKNNTGKSSILQSLFLLRQTLDSPDGPRLNLRGPLYRAGTYSDVVHQHLAKSHIEMRFDLKIGKTGRPTHIEIELASEEPQPPRFTRFTIKTDDIDTIEIRRARGRTGPYQLVIGEESQGNEKRANFSLPANRFLPLIGDEPPRVGRPNQRHDACRKFAREAIDEFERILGTFRAVGAFRREPDRRYEFQGRVPNRVDLAGDDVVNALIEDATRRGRRGELFGSVNRWLKQVGRVRLRPLRRISEKARLFEVRVRDTDSGRWANLADVGFGIGQAFPILVEGLRTPPGAMFFVQEPEIHLHPDAQLAMGDFLLDLVTKGRHVVVETHSENLLLRLRRRLIESRYNGRKRSTLSPDQVCVIYVAKNADGSSSARRLTVDQLGQIENWPREFMEEAMNERIELLNSTARNPES